MSNYAVHVTEEPVASGAVETILQVVSSASKGVEVVRWSVSMNGTNPSDTPVRVQILRVSSAGSSTAFTPLKIDPRDDSALATARTAHTAEPTPGDVLETYLVTPYGGLLYVSYAPDERIFVPTNGRIGIRVLSTTALNVSAHLVFSE